MLFLSNANFTVFLKELTGRIVECEVSLNWSVLMLKELFSQKEGTYSGYTSHAVLHLIVVLVGVLPQVIRVVYHGKLLEDTCTLSNYGIKEHDTIHIVYRLTGGGAWTALAYASVYHDWDGNMASRIFI